jgi:hypothetical protein
MKIIRTYPPEEVYNNRGIRILQVGKTTKKHDSVIYQVLMRDHKDRLWCSGDICVSNELINDIGTDHWLLMIELGLERMKNGIEYENKN